MYGDAPFSEAGLGYIAEKFNPRYDTQEEIYAAFFNELTDACGALSLSGDKITGDVIYNGDVNKWKNLPTVSASDLPCVYPMSIPDKAKQEFEEALMADGGVFTSASDDALIKYMEVSSAWSGHIFRLSWQCPFQTAVR